MGARLPETCCLRRHVEQKKIMYRKYVYSKAAPERLGADKGVVIHVYIQDARLRYMVSADVLAVLRRASCDHMARSSDIRHMLQLAQAPWWWVGIERWW